MAVNSETAFASEFFLQFFKVPTTKIHYPAALAANKVMMMFFRSDCVGRTFATRVNFTDESKFGQH